MTEKKGTNKKENLHKGNKMRKPTTIIKAAQNNNVIRTNYVKAKIDKTPLISKSRLCNDKGETINHIISEYSKLAPKD